MTTSLPSAAVANGIIGSSTARPHFSFAGSFSVSRPSTRTTSSSCTRPTPNVAGLNGAVFAALKPGGTYFVEDHAAVAGAPLTSTSTLHRIDPTTAISEIEAAGFKLDGKSDLLANPKDTKQLGVRDPSIQGETEKFALRFRKPG